jgi:NAD(P)H-dependent flavin oxidoreductase YrpB (nitropropane dioxygenase family)
VYTARFDRLNHALGGEAWPDGIAARVLENAMVRRWHGREEEMLQQLESLRLRYRAGQSRRDADVQALYAEMGVGAVRSVRTAADICSALVTTVSGERHTADAAKAERIQ